MSRRRNNSKKDKPEKDNYQDRAEDREYGKGERNGERLQRKFDSRKFKPMDILNKGDKPLSVKGSNDDSWHVPSAELVDSTSKINFQVADGLPLPMSAVDNVSTIGSANITRNPVASPGICVFEVFNSIGETNLQSDPFNQAGAMLFSYMQRTTGRTPSYSQAQVQMYLLAVTHAYTFYQWICRTYGLVNHRNFESRYVPEALVNALHCDYQTLRVQLANFRTFINQFALDISAIPLPANITYVDWMLHQYEYVYKDSDTEKAQLYAFNPAGFYVWTEGDATHPSTYLNFVPLNSGTNKDYALSFSALRTYADNLLTPLQYSEDFRMIKADILATFGDSLVKVTQIAETYTTAPIYNEEISSVIENSYVYGIKTDTLSSTIEEDASLNGGAVIAKYTYMLYGWDELTESKALNKGDILGALQTQELLFNWHEDTPPTPERCLSLTRYSGTGCNNMIPTSDGTLYTYHGFRNNCYNIICSMQLYSFVASSSGEGKPFVSSKRYATLNPVNIANIAVADPCAMWSKFDWAPSIRNVWFEVTTGASPTAAIYLDDYLCDIDKFALIPSEQLQNMNAVAMRGEFTPRGLGGYSPIK